ncbi:MAG: DNA polymerase III subunit beta [Oscillospiraceae bacterium]|nr:DNA polymerase III subunit beta [Candidatus Ruminococcus equi]
MKFTCMRTDLSNAVSNVVRAVSTKGTIPALEGILIKAYNNKLVLSGYDLEIGITTTVDATVTDEGEIVVSAKLFSDIVRRLPEEIVCIETDDRLITYITSGQANYQIVGISSADFPELPTFEETDKIVIKAELLKNMIRQTIFAVSDNMAKPVYTGSLFDIEDKVLKIVSVDGFRMAIREEAVDCESKNKFVVPGKTQSEVLKLITDDEKDVEIIIGQRQLIFKIENYSIVSRLIEGNFLDYKSTLPKTNQSEFVINTRILCAAVERMSLLTNEKIQSPVKCTISANEIKFSCSTSVGKANDVLPVSLVGQEVEIGFNNRYMLDALKNADTDEVKIILNGPLSPILIKPINFDSFTFLVVPMRLS